MMMQHIVSTMHRKDASFVEEMQCKCPVLVVNQAEGTGDVSTNMGSLSVRMITNSERGLSNSRNCLLDHAEGDICIVGDDDLLYAPGYVEIIGNAYRNYPKADIIVFRFSERLDADTRRIFAEPRRLGMLQISKVASVEVTFRLDSIRRAGLRFDTLLGLGAKFGSGEENAFLADALRAGLRIQYVPATICYCIEDQEDRRKWVDGFNEDYFVKKGACFYRIFGWLFLPMSAAFILLKKRSLFKNVPLFSALRWMLAGKREYRRMKKESLCASV